MMPQWISDLISVAPWLGAFFIALLAVWKVGPTLRKWGRFLDRVAGVPADPKTGQKEIPGLFERMDQQDEALAKQDEALEVIRHELFPNSGKSLRDAVDKYHKQLEDHLVNCPGAPQTTINVNPPGV
jgi:hypothetical protein